MSQMAGESGFRTRPPQHSNKPIERKKEQKKIQPTNSRLPKQTPFKGKLKIQDKKINKIFQ